MGVGVGGVTGVAMNSRHSFNSVPTSAAGRHQEDSEPNGQHANLLSLFIGHVIVAAQGQREAA